MPSLSQRPQEFSGSYGPDSAAIYDARKDFSRWLDDSVDDGDILDEMLVALSELMANAVAASKQPAGNITVQA